MFASEFVWCDLSTFDLPKACAFYTTVLNWSVHSPSASQRGVDYALFYAGPRPSAGVYTMPTSFQEIGMPSFWMSYVRVESLSRSVNLALELGAKCEIKPTQFDADSRFALIRDPAGAGFTLYEGPDLMGRDEMGRHGRMLWNELHVPSLSMVESFYRDLFGWEIVPDRRLSYRYTVQSSSGDSIASVLELDETTKGTKNYWAVLFATHNLSSTLQAIADNGGQVLMQTSAEIGTSMVTDNQGAMFCVLDADGN